MSHLVLSRKYRPKTFNEVLGQNNALTILKGFIEKDSLPHALIFCGSRGVGKTSMARILAKTINCDELLNTGKCSNDNSCSCREIDENKSIDVIEIDAASNNGVDQIREIIDSSNYSSIKCKYKVFIIDEAHMLSKAAFNALLKTLEEPNKNTIFILATTEIEKVPLTIISRCQTINFKNIKKEEIKGHLEEISKNEGISIDNESIRMIIDESKGSARDALGFLELLSSSLNKAIKINDASILLGKTPTQILSNITKNILVADTNKVLDEYNNIYESGYDSKKFISSLMNYFRTMIYYKLDLDNTVDDIEVLSDDEIANIKKYDLQILETLFDELIKLYDISSKSENIRFFIESNLIKLCIISDYLNFDLILDKDDSLERNNGIETSREPSIKAETKKKKLNPNVHNDSEENGSRKLISDVPSDNHDLATKKPNKNSQEGRGDNEFKFREKKDKLLESQSVKNLFDTFDCRILDVERED
ncbi:MAG: DNA polymerase III subunit gamma/tau [Thermodesulfobacteriota bacterium]|nr:DNA polymerase III subunit gamma/tau [Thermodesulfobacteriota bacterium]